jgi:hypothetical protein
LDLLRRRVAVLLSRANCGMTRRGMSPRFTPTDYKLLKIIVLADYEFCNRLQPSDGGLAFSPVQILEDAICPGLSATDIAHAFFFCPLDTWKRPNDAMAQLVPKGDIVPLIDHLVGAGEEHRRHF